ncbi:hypothetical protein SCHPADRAFT_569899 [Schizopora paradoxa]|uniref:Uncharacterized protein n=1 Tax=Schizopora paradoxa TaxID=27342 RepID=A0A0H2RC20_9AGAM|nr:hypothetical protein SCHPADRAFT_569899 [Schizopora paradoxa]
MFSQRTHLSTEELYAEKLNPLNLGHALYEPEPEAGEDEIRIGDIGYLFHGRFVRFASAFVTSTAIHALDTKYHRTMAFSSLDEGVLASRSVHSERAHLEVAAGDSMTGTSVGIGFNLTCKSNSGASLITKHSSKVEKSLFPRILKEHFVANCLSLLEYAHREELPIDTLHDIILVTGRVMTADWATIVFHEHSQGSEVIFDIKASTLTGSGSLWGKWSEHVSSPKRHGPPRPQNELSVNDVDAVRNQCIFIDACRVSQRTWFLKLVQWLRTPTSSAQNKIKDGTSSRPTKSCKTSTFPSSDAAPQSANTTNQAASAPSQLKHSDLLLTGYEILAYQIFQVKHPNVTWTFCA